MVRRCGKNSQPQRFKQSHAHNVLVLAAHSDVVEEDSFQFEAEPAVQIDIAHVMLRDWM